MSRAQGSKVLEIAHEEPQSIVFGTWAEQTKKVNRSKGLSVEGMFSQVQRPVEAKYLRWCTRILNAPSLDIGAEQAKKVKQ